MQQSVLQKSKNIHEIGRFFVHVGMYLNLYFYFACLKDKRNVIKLYNL